MPAFGIVIGGEQALRLALAAIGLAGLGIAIYLTTVHYQGESPACIAGGTGCAQVQDSVYAELASVPIPVIGIAGYVAVLLVAAVPGDLGRFAGLFTGIVGISFSAYLTYLELFEIEAICQWCVASAILMTVVFALTLVRAVRYGGAGEQPTS